MYIEMDPDIKSSLFCIALTLIAIVILTILIMTAIGWGPAMAHIKRFISRPSGNREKRLLQQN